MNAAVKKNLNAIARYFLYIVLIFVILFPLYWVVAMSLKDYKDIISYPPTFIFNVTLENYRQVLFGGKGIGELTAVPDFIKYIFNSCVTSFSAVGLALVLGLPAAYSLTREDSKFNRSVSANFMSYRFAPELAVLLPLYNIFKNTGLYDTFGGMILVHQLITLPLVIWIMMGFFREIPKEVEEAARLDSSNVWTVFFKVMLPMVKSGIGSAMIIAFVYSWNNLLFGLIMSGGNTTPVTLGILQAMTFDQIKWGEMAAAAVISALPGVMIAVFSQRFLVKGLTMGAIK